MARRIYKGCTIVHRLNLPVSDITKLEYLTILLHTKEDNDITKTYPADIAFENDEFVFTISSEDIVFLQEGILWATIDLRVAGVDLNKKIQLPYYIKYREGAASSTLITIADVEEVVDARISEDVDARIEERFSDLLDNVENNTAKVEAVIDDVAELEDRIEDLEKVDLSVYPLKSDLIPYAKKEELNDYAKKTDIPAPYNDATIRQRLDTLEAKEDKDTIYDDTALKNRIKALEERPIGGGDGDVIINNPPYDDTALKNRIKALEAKPDNDTIYDDTDIKNRVQGVEDRVQALENKPSGGEGGVIINPPYDDTDLKNRVASLEGIDHSQYLTEHQRLKTINGQSIVGSGNITITSGTGNGKSVSDSVDESGYAYVNTDGREGVEIGYDIDDAADTTTGSIVVGPEGVTIKGKEIKFLDQNGNEIQVGGSNCDCDPYDDTDLKNRVQALEDRPIGGGSNCDCEPYDDTVLRELVAALTARVQQLENALDQYHILTVDVTPAEANLNVDQNE